MPRQATLLSATEEEVCCMELIERGRLGTEVVFAHFKLEVGHLKVVFMKSTDLPCCNA
jgi:hypothetical protein